MGKPYFTWLRAARAYGADYEATDSFFWGDDGTAIPEPRVANDPSLEAGVVTPNSVGSGDSQGRKYRFVASDFWFCYDTVVIDGQANKVDTIVRRARRPRHRAPPHRPILSLVLVRAGGLLATV